MTDKEEMLIQITFSLLDRAQALSALFNAARAAGRDISDAEIDFALAADEAAEEKLQNDIDAARAAAP